MGKLSAKSRAKSCQCKRTLIEEKLRNIVFKKSCFGSHVNVWNYFVAPGRFSSSLLRQSACLTRRFIHTADF